MEENKFSPLLKAKGFERVELLQDGSANFERRYFWRTAKCTMNGKEEVIDCKVNLNWGNCIICAILGFLPIVLVILIGLHTKEDLKYEVHRLISKE